MRRAAVSVPANIVEGSMRKHRSEYLQFLYIGASSLAELGYYIGLSKRLGYIKEVQFQKLNLEYEKTAKVLRGLIRYIEESKV